MEEPYNKLSSLLAKILGKRWMKDRGQNPNSEMSNAANTKRDPPRSTELSDNTSRPRKKV